MLRKVLYGMVASAVLALLPGIALAQGDTARPVDPPQQVAQLRQQFEGLTPQQVEAKGYMAEGGCVPSPSGEGAMGTHAVNRQLYEDQFPKGEMDPDNPPVVLLGPSDEVIGVEWEAKDVGQGPMKVFGQTIELQSAHPGVPEPHYMLHIYFRDDGKVLFGTNDETAFDPEGFCPEMSASAMHSSSPSASAAATASAAASATATSSASALVGTGGMSPMPVLAAGALALLVAGGLLAAALVRRS
ncbi:MAG TPA: hypothetical protein VFR69_12430 [Rubrobacteraceae bacterium]|nr:hypothetical protein [Rubrobacteraceae bacterium]